ncbi:hypothetical protein MUK42_37122 [Musa troglodytarum]|uniref:Uncharacterized protein n=1 Tax=Musa troglodytarum TaxID=320322 RepID=A0A9E7KN04_9LILI|nr:hypothetical protein MUK42_37122 [Musa troglodytarum]
MGGSTRAVASLDVLLLPRSAALDGVITVGHKKLNRGEHGRCLLLLLLLPLYMGIGEVLIVALFHSGVFFCFIFFTRMTRPPPSHE